MSEIKREYMYDSQTEDFCFSLKKQQYTDEIITEQFPITTQIYGEDEEGNVIVTGEETTYETQERTERKYIGSPERLAVAPGEFDKVETFAPPLLVEFQTIWTPAIIQAWEEKNYIPPAPEYNSETHAVYWDYSTKQWIISPIPPAPPTPGQQFTDDEADWVRGLVHGVGGVGV